MNQKKLSIIEECDQVRPTEMDCKILDFVSSYLVEITAVHTCGEMVSPAVWGLAIWSTVNIEDCYCVLTAAGTIRSIFAFLCNEVTNLGCRYGRNGKNLFSAEACIDPQVLRETNEDVFVIYFDVMNASVVPVRCGLYGLSQFSFHCVVKVCPE